MVDEAVFRADLTGKGPERRRMHLGAEFCRLLDLRDGLIVRVVLAAVGDP